MWTKVIIYDNIESGLEGAMKGKDIGKEQLAPRYEVVEQLKKARKEQNITQQMLAERVGTQKSNISRLESGKYNPSLDFLIKVADCLDKEIKILLKT